MNNSHSHSRVNVKYICMRFSFALLFPSSLRQVNILRLESHFFILPLHLTDLSRMVWNSFCLSSADQEPTAINLDLPLGNDEWKIFFKKSSFHSSSLPCAHFPSFPASSVGYVLSFHTQVMALYLYLQI